ncbi:uncharacterized protein DC041_0001245 [Schistosoma bovis]|uniref:RRM domain-containing protein n=1 Tax=Schistosoma bovis TaxID=6184 RepID=A0A430Q1W5_SCHBO|nr:uncharacterized protein DC041_0001245 [Schistosoma bovis]
MSVIIRLQNLPISANASNIRRFFSGLSIPEGGVHIVGGTEGDAFIAFATDEDARKAMLLDRQTINGASVRLFLSSKAEMQSIIESAKTSALFSSGGNPVLSQSISQKTETMHALDVTAPTLPSSFPSYRNGATRESFDDSSKQYPYTYSKGVTLDPPRGQIESAERNNPDKYPENLPPDRPHFSQDRDYSYNNQPNMHSRYDAIRDFPPTNDYGPRDTYLNNRGDLGHRSYRDDYDYSRHPPSITSEDNFVPRGKDNEGKSSPRDSYADPYSALHVSDGMTTDYDKYRAQSPRVFNDRFPPHDIQSREFGHGNTHPFPSEFRSGPGHPLDRETACTDSRLQEERDFSVRPPWLNDNAPVSGPKRPFQHQTSDFEEYPRKRRPQPSSYTRPSDIVPGETDYVLRVCLPAPEAGIKTVFEVLRGVQVVPKWGIRVEEDLLQRPTGYVFIMMTTRDSYERALSFNNRPHKGDVIKVVKCTLSEFYSVSDTNFTSKCPPEVAKKLPPPDQFYPPHYNDGCLELAELPSDTTKTEVVRFLGAPGLTCENVVLARFPPNDKSAPRSTNLTRALVTLPSAEDIKILLSAKPRPFRPDVGLPSVRLTPISKLQVTAYSALAIGSKSESTKESIKPPVPRDVDSEPTKPPGGFLTCACVSGFSRTVKDSEVLNLFPSILIPGDAVRLAPDANIAFIDFISENNCRRAVNEASTEGSKAKQSHPSLHIEAISREEMLNRLGADPKDEQLNFDRPGRSRDRDPRESRIHWEQRQRPSPSNPFESRPPSVGRAKYDDSYYDRPAVPAPFDDHHDSFRRFRPPVDNLHSIPPHQSDISSVPRQPVPLPHRRPVPDFVTVFVGNLPPACTVDQLAGIMRDYYFVPGSIRLRRDPQGQFVGEALVDFKTSYEADRALRGLNGYRVAGRPLVLHFDHRK